jgi:catechol 2,3-dioxygenase-like lactoylglutathione lyase family enzyme
MKVLLWAALAGTLVAAEPLPITGVAHVEFKVSDLEKARAFYTSVLGYQEAGFVNDAAGKLETTWFKVNDNQFIKITPILKPGEDVRFIHTTFETPDIQKLCKILEERDLKPTKISTGKDRDQRCQITDPEGNRLEFIQYMPDGIEAKAKGKFMDKPRISTHMLHSGMMIKDVDRALAFYGGKLGLVEFWRGGPPNQTLWYNLRVPGPRQDYVELLLVTGTPSRETLGTEQHIALDVPDIHAARKFALAHGYPDTPAFQPHVGRNKKQQLNLFDPDGTRVECMEPKETPQP